MSRSLASALLLALAACSNGPSDGGEPPPPDTVISLQLAAGGFKFAAPVFLTAPANDPRIFVVEQPGRIRIVQGESVLATSFLDISAKVSCCGEQGLLSVAFHPRYDQNGLFYVNYTDTAGDTRVERYRVSATDPNRADPASMQLVLFVDQPFVNHNGGQLQFGPDGRLYIGMGDGGGGGDPHEHGQNASTLLGDILRLNVDAVGQPYSIPAGNPFLGQAGRRPEIWAMGVRNPWRFSFDRATNLLYVADVGQMQWEEVNVVPAGRAGVNYGWVIMEGTHCFRPATGCPQAGLTLPVLEYSHAEGCSITGGYVYRGQAIPELRGHYFYADYCQGWIRSFRHDNGTAADQREWEVAFVGTISSFGEDSAGELYVLSHSHGFVYRIVRAS